MKRTQKTSRRIPEEQAASREEIASAVEALTRAELWRLEQYARWRVKGMGRAAKGREWEDLLRQAIAATYEGSRSWRKESVDFRRHLEGVMRSISSHERDQFDTDEAWLESDVVHTSAEGETINPLHKAESPTPSPQRALEAQAEVERIDAIANKNPLAWLIWDSLRGGMDGPGIRDALSISQKEYDTAMKWLRRNVRQRESKEGK